MKKIIFSFSALSKKSLFALCFSSLFIALIEVFSISLIVPFIALLNKVDSLHTNVILNRLYLFLKCSSDRQFLIYLGTSIIIMMFLKNLITWGVKSLHFKFSYEAQHFFSVKLIRSYLSNNYLYFTHASSPLLIRNITNITGSLVTGLMIPTLAFFTDCLILFAIASMLFWVNWKITLQLSIVLTLGFLLLQVPLRKRINELAQIKNKTFGEIHQLLSEVFQGIKDIKVLNKENFFIDRFTSRSFNLVHSETSYNIINLLPSLVLEFVGFSIILLIIMYYITSGIELAAIIPTISFYILAAYRLMPSLTRMPMNLHSMRFYSFAMDLVFEEISQIAPQPLHLKKGELRNKVPLLDSIELKNVSFSYPSNPNFSIQNMDLKLKRNTTIGFVGPSGGGKTTLVDLLMGLYLPSGGKISVDGHIVIDNNNVEAWRNNIGYIPQQIFLFDDTIAQNIALGVDAEAIDKDRLWNAIRIAQLSDVVDPLPKGVDTIVGEKGVRLSGGQRQRIGIARALYHDPEFIIMDEATSSLDTLTESELVNEIYKLREVKTLLIIAHRLSTIKACDIIYVIDKGKIVARGTYDEVKQNCELFQRMTFVHEHGHERRVEFEYDL